MKKKGKLLGKILSGSSDQNIDFYDLKRLLESFNFNCRIKGDHHIYYREDVEEIINIQPLSDGKAKPYQVKQIRMLVLKYKLNLDTNE